MKRSLAAYESGEQPNFNLKLCINLLSTAWNDVTTSTTANCWHYARFSRVIVDDHIKEEIEDTPTLPLDNIFDRLRQFMHIPSVVVQAMYVSLDNDLPTYDIGCSGQIQLPFSEEPNSDCENEEPELKLPSADVLKSLET